MTNDYEYVYDYSSDYKYKYNYYLELATIIITYISNRQSQYE